MVKRMLAIASLALACLPVAADGASGKGAGMMAAPGGVTSAGSPYRYIAIHPSVAGAPTLVERTILDGGNVDRWWYLRGHYYVPAVAYDGTGGGLSAEGGTLVLTRFTRSYPPRRSRFAVLNTNTYLRHPLRSGEQRPRHAVSRFSLPGFYSFDAISPDGERLYLIHYLSSRGPADYEVRAFDLPSGRLLPDPVVDPKEAEEQMQGLPITRAMSPDGRWAYTLYDGNGKEPFLHALDTVGGRAVCVDLPQLTDRRNLFLLKLSIDPGGRRLVVRSDSAVQDRPRSRPLLTIDTRSFAVRRPAPVAAASSGDTVPWVPIGIAAGVLAAALIWIIARRERMADHRALGQG
jgi:hypothetical protein